MSSFPEPIYADSIWPEPISPELALVSPELAAIARATLPDRPWEAFFQPAADLRGPTILQFPTVVRSAPAVEEVAFLPASRRRRPRVPVGLILLTAFVGLLVAGSVLPVRDAPTLGPPPARANGLTVPQGPPARPQGPQISTTPARLTAKTPTVPAVSSAPPSAIVSHASRVAPTRRAAVTRAAHSLARPHGGYTLSRGIGLLLVGASARSIAELRANIGCGREIVHGIGISSNGRFSARRSVRGQPRATVTVNGVFTRAGTVRGTISVKNGRCESGPIGFTGRVS